MRLPRTAIVFGCAGLALALQASAAAAQSPAVDVRENERRLEQIRQERERVDQEISAARFQVRELSGGVRQLDREVGGSAEALRALESELGQQHEEINQTARDLIVTRNRLAERRGTLHRRLRTIYKRGPLHTAQVLLSASSFSELIHRYKYLVLVARHDRELVREVAILETQLVARERLLERSIASLHDARTESSVVRDQLGRVLAEQERELAAASARERMAAERAAQLERNEQSIRALLASFRNAPAPSSAESSPAAPVSPEAAMISGGLSLPVQGPLLYGFGRAAQENGTAIRWNGIGIAAPAGSPVRAVDAGTVVMAGPFDGYGPTVVLSHGGGFYSLYLYLQQISVREGETINRNQVVGSVGGNDTPEGPHIEFQIRGPGGAAVDPLAWLQERQID